VAIPTFASRHRQFCCDNNQIGIEQLCLRLVVERAADFRMTRARVSACDRHHRCCCSCPIAHCPTSAHPACTGGPPVLKLPPPASTSRPNWLTGARAFIPTAVILGSSAYRPFQRHGCASSSNSCVSSAYFVAEAHDQAQAILLLLLG